MKSAISKFLIPFIVLLALSSCSPSYHFKVDAISGGELSKGKSFVLISGNAEMKESDLRFREAANLVQTGLEGKGMHRAKDIASADLLIELTFGVGEPREVMEVRSYPETHWHPGFSYAIRIPIYDKNGLIVSYQNRVVREPPRSYTYWDERVDSSTIFEKYLEIAAYDNRLGSAVNDPEQIWGLVITNADYSDNIREYLPYMIAAALPYIGEDTGSQIHVSLKQDDPTVNFIRDPDASISQQP